MRRHAAAGAAPLLLGAGPAAIANRSIYPARWANGSKPAARCCSCRQLGQTDGRIPYSFAAYYAAVSTTSDWQSGIAVA